MMVAESTNALSPITIDTCLGERTFCSPTELHTAIGELYRAVNQSNLQAAKAYFALGEMLVKGHDELLKKTPTASLKGLMIRAGVHHQKGYRATQWYKTLLDPATGGFCEKRYDEGAHLVREEVQSGRRRAKFDQQGNPSIRAMETTMGLRGNDPSGTRICYPRVTDFDDSASQSQMWDSIDELAGGDEPAVDSLPLSASDNAPKTTTTPRTRPSPFTSSGRAAGAAGDQMMIDFDFRASGQSIHDSLDAVAELADRGTLDPAHAAGVKRKVVELMGYINSIGDPDTSDPDDDQTGGGA